MQIEDDGMMWVKAWSDLCPSFWLHLPIDATVEDLKAGIFYSKATYVNAFFVPGGLVSADVVGKYVQAFCTSGQRMQEAKNKQLLTRFEKTRHK